LTYNSNKIKWRKEEMASNVSTVDGMGFEEVNQSSYTEMISGNNLYGQNLWISNMAELNIISGAVFSGGEFRESNRGVLHSTCIENAAEIFGQRVKAGSIVMGNDVSGLINFKTPFTGSNWFISLTPTTYGAPQWSRTGSQGLAYGVSGLKRTSGCWIVGGSKTVVDWIAVGI